MKQLCWERSNDTRSTLRIYLEGGLYCWASVFPVSYVSGDVFIMIESWQLAQRQSLPLEAKVVRSQQKIREWHDAWHGDIYVAVSGKDSHVLLDMVRELYPNVPGMFVDTGLEFPEIREFNATVRDIVWEKPKMNFRKVIEHYGYPVVSKEQSQFISECRNTKSEKLRRIRLEGNKAGRGKIHKKWRYLLNAPFAISHKCCDVMKKNPSKAFEKATGLYPMLGTMAADSQLRRQRYMREGCNGFNAKRPTSTPMGPWLDKDVWEYIHTRKLPYSKIYDMGEKNTGCMFCMFGCHKDSPNRFQRMKISHPKQWEYCMNKLGLQEVLDYMGVPSSGVTQKVMFEGSARGRD